MLKWPDSRVLNAVSEEQLVVECMRLLRLTKNLPNMFLGVEFHFLNY